MHVFASIKTRVSCQKRAILTYGEGPGRSPALFGSDIQRVTS